METKLPEYLKLDTSGKEDRITVTLLKGVKVDGETRKSLTLREPSVGDNMAAREMGNKDAAMSEVILIANMAGVPPEVIQGAKMRDYSRLQEALDFLNG